MQKKGGKRKRSAAQKTAQARFACAARTAAAKKRKDPRLDFGVQMRKEINKVK